ncbi:MAG: hypothetical protein HYS81_04055 [Candidatus Aenigmatarchaeota archaeon]|nr:MAG: hypothetical protein HYS81_04055 [Candidatus Aenigmarchaeota archaeon]
MATEAHEIRANELAVADDGTIRKNDLVLIEIPRRDGDGRLMDPQPMDERGNPLPPRGVIFYYAGPTVGKGQLPGNPERVGTYMFSGGMIDRCFEDLELDPAADRIFVNGQAREMHRTVIEQYEHEVKPPNAC